MYIESNSESLYPNFITNMASLTTTMSTICDNNYNEEVYTFPT